MHNATPDGDSFQGVEIGSGGNMHDSSISQRGVLKVRRPPLASMPGVGYDSLAHSPDPPSVVSISLSPVRAGNMLPYLVWHGFPAEAPHSPLISGEFQELLPMRVDVLVFERPGSCVGQGRHLAHLNPHITSDIDEHDGSGRAGW